MYIMYNPNAKPRNLLKRYLAVEELPSLTGARKCTRWAPGRSAMPLSKKFNADEMRIGLRTARRVMWKRSSEQD
jgi:hypothetical protein